MERYRLIVIGGGAGGLTVAVVAALLGARVALPEKDRMGGDRLNDGCVPSKARLKAAAVGEVSLRNSTRSGLAIPYILSPRAASK